MKSDINRGIIVHDPAPVTGAPVLLEGGGVLGLSEEMLGAQWGHQDESLRPDSLFRGKPKQYTQKESG